MHGFPCPAVVTESVADQPKLGDCRTSPTACRNAGDHNAEVSRPAQISFKKWQAPVQRAASVEELLLVVAAYLSAWPIEELMRLPQSLVAPIRSPDELAARAVELNHAEIDFAGNSEAQDALRELALVISAAAARLAFLQSPRVALHK